MAVNLVEEYCTRYWSQPPPLILREANLLRVAAEDEYGDWIYRLRQRWNLQLAEAALVCYLGFGSVW